MNCRNKYAGKVLLALALAAAAVSGCGKEKAKTADIREAKEPQETMQEFSQNAAPQLIDTASEGVRTASDADEEVMDVICAASGIAVTKDGTLLVTDTYNKVVWEVEDGSAVVYAGGETVTDLYGEPLGGYNDAGLEDSFFACPWDIAPFLDGWAVSDADNDAVRLISEDKVRTVNGTTTERLIIKNLGVAFEHPTGLAADADGNLYVSDTYSGAVRKITPDGAVSTVAKGLEEPMGICWKDGTLYVTETGANRIVTVKDGQAEVLAGSGESGYADGAAEEAMFAYPQGIAVADDGTVYVSDTGNSAVRAIRNGEVATLLSRDRASLDMSPVSPAGLLIAGDELYICDSFARKVLQVTLQ